MATLLFSDGFETNDFSKWYFVWREARWSVVSDVKHSGTYGARTHYIIATGGDEHQDDNEFISFNDTTPDIHFYISGY